jgi:hypothetical protein
MPVPPRASEGSQLQRSLDLLHQLYLDVEAAGAELEGVGRIQQTVRALRRQPNLDALPSSLLHVSDELSRALDSIRQTREALKSCSVGQLRDTHARLDEVSSTTESAAMELLNGLDRTLAMIDRLESCAGGQEPDAACAALRNEVNQLYGHLQFQDIIAQQLRGVGAMLVEIEQRFEGVARVFDGPVGEGPAGSALPEAGAFNPDASMRDARERQAAIDEAFRSAGAAERRAAAG